MMLILILLFSSIWCEMDSNYEQDSTLKDTILNLITMFQHKSTQESSISTFNLKKIRKLRARSPYHLWVM